jgi:glycine dehydrogenase subunit 1
MFEYQTHLSRLTEMDVVVPSIYDGASATAEAVLMSMRLTKKNKIIVSSLLHPHYLETLKTYVEPHKTVITVIPHQDGLTDFEKFKKELTNDTAAIVIQSPNFLGGIEDVQKFVQYAHQNNILVIQVITESLSLGILKPPGEMDVDIVSGEAQSFGMDLNFGGPYNGYLASKMKYIRQIPGRIAGETSDRHGNRGFVMTFRAREQDIRREKATSNICSNHALNIVAGNVYLSLLGKEGLKSLSVLNVKASHYLKEKLIKTGQFLEINYPFFNEFMIKTKDKEKVINNLKENGFIPPLDLSEFYPELEDYLLFAVTEIFSKNDLDYITELISR